MANERNILLIANNFPPQRGGSAVVYDSLARHSNGRIIVMAASRAYLDGLPIIGWREHDRRARYRIIRLGLLRTLMRDQRGGTLSELAFLLRDLVLRIQVFSRIVLLLLTARISAVCVGELVASGWIVHLLHRFTRIRTAIYVHGEEILTEAGYDPGHARATGALIAADRIFVVSAFTAEAVRARIGAANAGKIRLIENGVDTTVFTPKPRRQDLAEGYGLANCFVYVSVCRLLEKKGVDMAIRAFAEIHRKHPETRYLVVGTGPYEAELRRLADSLGLGSAVIFAGDVAPPDLVAHYCLGDVFVMPNRALPNGDTEGFGLVFLEANACGLPVIGGRDGGTAAAVRHGGNGLLVDGNDLPGITDAMLRLREDDALRDRLGANGLQAAARAGWQGKAHLFREACLLE